MKKKLHFPCSFASTSPNRMMLANYLGQKGQDTCLRGVVVFSAGWDVFECTASLEKPLDRFLFNSYLTSCLQASVDRSVRGGGVAFDPEAQACRCGVVPSLTLLSVWAGGFLAQLLGLVSNDETYPNQYSYVWQPVYSLRMGSLII